LAAAQQQPRLDDIALCTGEAEPRAPTPIAFPRPVPPGRAPESDGALSDHGSGGARDWPKRAPSPRADTGETTDSTGSVLTQPADPLLTGMDARRSDDAAYLAAYRECMQWRTRNGG
jgi:hypothetical protein